MVVVSEKIYISWMGMKKNREKLLSQIGIMACTFPDIFLQIRMGVSNMLILIMHEMRF